jgi:hypothetical protein
MNDSKPENRPEPTTFPVEKPLDVVADPRDGGYAITEGN